MSTAQVNLLELKQEVNRRIAEHRSRKGAPDAGPRAVEAPQGGASLRAAEAAARVAQRFAHAPSYGDVLAELPRTAPKGEGRSGPTAAKQPDEPMPQTFARTARENAAKPQPAAAIEREEPRPAASPRQDARTGARLLGGAAAAAIMEPPVQEWGGAIAVEEMPAAEAEPVHGNLIEFPRELVAARKMRPRLAEAPLAAGRDAQLSIFEVDPGAVSTVAAPADAHPSAEWSQPEWSGIKLDAHAEEEIAQAAAAAAAEIELAPMSRRLLALCVDATLIAAAVIAAGWMFVESTTALPGLRHMAMGALAAFVALGILYELLFFTLAQATPGMRYAHIGLWTFTNQPPTREQRWRRLAATALSVLPMGLGLVWSLVDEERMCWHDRLSQTYLKSSF